MLELSDVPLIAEPFHWVKNLFSKRSSPIAVQLLDDSNYEFPEMLTMSNLEAIEPVWQVENGQVVLGLHLLGALQCLVHNDLSVLRLLFQDRELQLVFPM